MWAKTRWRLASTKVTKLVLEPKPNAFLAAFGPGN